MIKNMLIGFLTIVVGVLGGLLITSDGDADILSRKAECQKLGEAQHKKLVEEFARDVTTATMFRPEYTYSPMLRTCLYASGAHQPSGDGGVFVQNWVIDSYTNEELLSFYSRNGSLLPRSLSQDEFALRKRELFEESL